MGRAAICIGFGNSGRIECRERFRLASERLHLINIRKHLQSSFILASGLALSLASASPAHADLFSFFNWPHYRNWGQSRPHKPHQKAHRPSNNSEIQAQSEQQPRGPFQVIVSIASQQVSLYGRDGFIAGAPISTGMPAHPTPIGVFTVISKARWHESNIYSRAPMPYMERITWSGIALHAGPRPGYPASHGCIRLPQDFAVRLFHLTRIGTRVIVAREPSAPLEITHPNLFDPKKAEQTAALASPLMEGATGIATDAPRPVKSSATAAATTDASTAVPVDPKLAVGGAKPISIFVSRKQGRVLVRQGFKQLFDLPIKIDHPDLPIGTHIFTAMEVKDDGKIMRWTDVSIPSQYPHHLRRSGKHHEGSQAIDTDQVVATPSTAAEALDRITWPPEAIDQISSLLMVGSSIVVSDNALSDETGSDTDFIVLTP